ncbi:MAG: acetyltransferase [Bacteroidia bacterium]
MVESSNNTPEILLFGAGGHGKALSSLLHTAGFACIGIFDVAGAEKFENAYTLFLGVYSPSLFPDCPIIVTVGNNRVRNEVAQIIQHRFATFVHPSAQLADNVTIGEGTVILQNAVIQANSHVGKHCIINIGACIDHDCNIQDAVHISPLSYIGSNSNISSRSLIEPGKIISRFSAI